MTGPGDTEPPGKQNIPLLDACLSYIQFCRITKDKNYVQEATCAKFSFPVIKAAYQAIFKYAYPETAFTYRGPNKSSPREKAFHASNEIYQLLRKLDDEDKSPIIACRSEDLRQVLPAGGQIDFVAIEDRLRSVESDMDKIRYLEKSVSDMKIDMQNMKNPELTTQRVQRTGVNYPPLRNVPASLITRSRDDSVSSVKRGRSHDSSNDTSSDDNDSDKFVHPKRVQKREARRRRRDKKQKLNTDIDNNNRVSSYSSLAKNGVPKPNANRRPPAVWGKSLIPATSQDLLGAVPDVFLFNCDGQPDEEKVQSFLTSREIVSKSVKTMSHKDAYKRSFRVTVATYTDYDKLMSGEHLPRGVGVRPFVNSRARVANKMWEVESASAVIHALPDHIRSSSNHSITRLIQQDGKTATIPSSGGHVST